MITRKQKSLFNQTINKVYPAVRYPDKTIKYPSWHIYLIYRKTFKLGINPIEKDFKAYMKALKAERRRLRKPGRLRNVA